MGSQRVRHDFATEQQQDCSMSYYALIKHLFNLFCEMSVQVLSILKICFMYYSIVSVPFYNYFKFILFMYF